MARKVWVVERETKGKWSVYVPGGTRQLARYFYRRYAKEYPKNKWRIVPYFPEEPSHEAE